MKSIALYARTGPVAYALVDDADAELLRRWNWRRDRQGYVVRFDSATDRTFYMARVILGLAHGDPLEADHKNRDKLDNRRSNLRAVTHAENMQNYPALGGSSPHRGVYYHRERKKWVAQAKLGGTTRYIGIFETEDEAARAAAAFRAEHMPGAIEEVAA